MSTANRNISKSKYQEKRSSFRIDDEVILTYMFISEKNLEREIKKMGSVGNGNTASDLMRELQQTGEQVNSQIKKVSPRYPQIGRALSAMNRKIDAALVVLLNSQDNDDLGSRQLVNISSTGIAFSCNEPVEIDTKVKLEFKLLPGFKGITAIAGVAANHPFCKLSNGKPALALEYLYIADKDREILETHILQKDIQRRRALMGNA